MLAVGAGGGCLDIFSLIYHFSFLSPSLWETARYELKYCLKGPLSPKQPTNQWACAPMIAQTYVRIESLRCSTLACVKPSDFSRTNVVQAPEISQGWSGGAMMLGKLPVLGRPTILITVGQGPIALAEGVVRGGLVIFILIYPFSSASPSL